MIRFIYFTKTTLYQLEKKLEEYELSGYIVDYFVLNHFFVFQPLKLDKAKKVKTRKRILKKGTVERAGSYFVVFSELRNGQPPIAMTLKHKYEAVRVNSVFTLPINQMVLYYSNKEIPEAEKQELEKKRDFYLIDIIKDEMVLVGYITGTLIFMLLTSFIPNQPKVNVPLIVALLIPSLYSFIHMAYQLHIIKKERI